MSAERKGTYEVVVHDEAKKTVEEGEIDLLVDLAELRLHEHYERRKSAMAHSSKPDAKTHRSEEHTSELQSQ